MLEGRLKAFAGSTLWFSWAMLTAPALGAQTDASSIRVFLDCSTQGCDQEFFREQITYVNWVRDRADSNVHLLVTSERTGGGGNAYALAFLGREAFEGVSDTLPHVASSVATPDELRQGLALVIRAGLLRYQALADELARVEIRARGGPGQGPPTGGESAVDDPWDSWVFRVSLNSFLNGESSVSFTNFGSGLTASRVTEALKIDLGFNHSYSEQKFELSDGTSRSITRTAGASASVVKSVGPQWALGAQATASHDSRQNQDLTWRFAPAVEYNIYPYSESTRRQLTLQYSVGFNDFEYIEETLFGRVSESRYDHTLAAGIEQNQPWGSVNFTVVGSQFLHDVSKYSVSGSGGVRLRLTRGLDLRINGSYTWIRDQLYLPRRTLDDEEILLRLRQLETSFRYFTSIGFTYRFGSIFNNVVNPRLRFRGRGSNVVFF